MSNDKLGKNPAVADEPFDRKLACSIAPALRMLYSQAGLACSLFFTDEQISALFSDPNRSAQSPCKILLIEPDADIGSAFNEYAGRTGAKPEIVAVKGLGFFALGKNKKAADEARSRFLNGSGADVSGADVSGADVSRAEVSRAEVSGPDTAVGRLAGRIAIVTGGSQGFGKGIAESLAADGAYVVVASRNINGVSSSAALINERYGPYRAIAVAADVTDEASVEHLIQETVLEFGGLDILVSNAGVLIAGGLDELTKESFDSVTKTNYTGYFLCTKYAVQPMKIQSRFSPGYMMDIIEINSKSGLEGSKKNYAYAGSKFGGIGLTQSFAMELVEFGIKVNAICPGNLLDGPLWSDPERGLFRQYLDQGKVEGAKTIDDVRRFYEDKVPMKRGCTISDVARAIVYVIEQKYETGQAIPVTGGQVMLH